ncbi:hypothetical protein HanPI659440_Chr16g0634511 [Helianthus annuus]|nr:hypothetical protein HanPI659440_Chr16g0634511 [Helianthus annuus]
MPSVIAPASTASPSLHTASSVLSTRPVCFVRYWIRKLLNDMFACAFEQHREKGVATMLPVALAIYDVPGLPPLNIIEDMSYEKNTRKSTRADIERQIQEEIAKSRVRQVDSQGRAYGTGKKEM